MKAADKIPKLPPVEAEITDLLTQMQATTGWDAQTDVIGPAVVEAIRAAALDQEHDYAPVKEAVQRTVKAAARWQVILENMLQQVEDLSLRRAEHERYGPAWWQKRRTELHEAFTQDPDSGCTQWLKTYAEALVAWELELCADLVKEPFPFPDSFASKDHVLCQVGTDALRRDDYAGALDMLEYLVQTKAEQEPEFLLDPVSRAVLLIFSGRIHLYRTGDSESALTLFEQASETAPDDGRPKAALGEYVRAQGDGAQAGPFFREAIEKSPSLPDGYLGLAWVAEDRQDWDEATQWYDAAAERVREERNPLTALTKHLAPVTGNAYLSLARVLKKQSPEFALAVVETALDRGISKHPPYPERLGYRLKGELCETLERPQEAAEAYYEAGRRFYWRGDYQPAVEHFERAVARNPDLVPTYWYLADTLIVQSYQPEPPYADAKLVQKSANWWERGVALAPPEADFSWAYVTRALINEQQLRLLRPDELSRRWSLLWEAVVYLERALLHKSDDRHRWAYLGRYYRSLMRWRNALEVTRKASELDPDESSELVLEERVAITASVRRFADAQRAIEARLKLEENAWTKGVQAYTLYQTGMYEQALAVVDPLIKTGSFDAWSFELRAACRTMLDDPVGARQDYQRIFDYFQESDEALTIDNLLSYAFAARRLGDFDTAIRLVQPLLDDPIDGINARIDLGFSYLARGDLEDARATLQTGISLVREGWRLDTLLHDELKLLEKFAQEWDHGDQILSTLAWIKGQFEQRREELDPFRSAETELLEILEELEGQMDGANWVWVGAKAGLARLYRAHNSWKKSAEIYAELQDRASDRFPEARRAWEGVMDELQAEGDQLLTVGKSQDAMTRFDQAIDLALPVGDKKRMAELFSRKGYTLFDLGEMVSAQRYFRDALQLFHGEDFSDLTVALARMILGEGGLGAKLRRLPGMFSTWREASSHSVQSSETALADIVGPLVRDVKQYWALQDLWKSTERILLPSLRPKLASARQALESYLDELFQLAGKAEDTTELFPVATPIVLEIAASLVPEDTSEDTWPLFKTYIPEMQERLRNQMGVRVSGVRVRSNEGDLPDDAYIIMIGEIPLVMGSVQSDRIYCLASRHDLTQRGIPGDTIVDAAHPLTGEPGGWVPPGYEDRLNELGVTFWSDPLIFIIYHLEAVLRRDLAYFMGVQATGNLLEDWSKDDELSELIQSILPGRETRVQFSRVLQALLKESVPVTEARAILEAVRQVGLSKDETEAVEAVRLHEKVALPGAGFGDKRVDLPPDLEERIAPWLRNVDGKRFLAAPPQEVQEWLGEIRTLLASAGGTAALVVQRAELRPKLRRLVELEHPDLMVLSQAELHKGDRVND